MGPFGDAAVPLSRKVPRMDVKVAVVTEKINPDAEPFAMDSSKRRQQICDAVVEAGAQLVDADEANALVWLQMGSAATLIELLERNPQIFWVQLPWAGVENFLEGGLFTRDVKFTCAKGAYATQVAEHALMLTLALMRRVPKQSRTSGWLQVEPDSLFGKRITVLGGGGIATSYLKLTAPFGCAATVLRKQQVAHELADRTLPIDELHLALPETDVLVLALPLTPENVGIIGAAELALMPKGAYVVNVARGRHVVTEALIGALERGQLAGAGLDVTEPEPLPADSALWKMDNVLVTSHCADSLVYVSQQLAIRSAENVRRLISGDELVGLVDTSVGY